MLGTLESSSPSGHILRLVLEQADDRVSHRIEVLDSVSHLLAGLSSIEGTGADEWPPSPALQSCSLQEIRPGKKAAFLVGMAGKSHWSASMEAIPQEGMLVFDFACRVQQQPQWLGTTYSIHLPSPESVTCFQQSPRGIAVRITNPDGENQDIALSSAGKQPLRLECPDRSPAKFPATVRWRYEIYLSGTPDC